MLLNKDGHTNFLQRAALIASDLGGPDPEDLRCHCPQEVISVRPILLRECQDGIS